MEMLRGELEYFLSYNFGGFINGVPCHNGAAAGKRPGAPVELVGIAGHHIDPVHTHAQLLGDNLCKTREMTLSLCTHARDNRDAPAAHHLYFRAFIRTDACAFHIRDQSNAYIFSFGA